MITKNCEDVIDEALKSANGLVDEFIIVDGKSTDSTVEIANKYKAKIFYLDEEDLGKKRAYALSKAKCKWILILDSDERLSVNLRSEIKEIINSSTQFDGFLIPYQNHFLGNKLCHGGEDYKILRLFRKSKGHIYPAFVHEKVSLSKEKIGQLRNKIFHYSYRSLFQVYRKFTDYALREARQKKEKSERTSLKKIVLYPVHMFWARFVEDKGYKDGFFRILLDLGFAYMEFLTYFSMLFLKKKR